MHKLILVSMLCISCGGEAAKTKSTKDYLQQLGEYPFEIFYRGWLRSNPEKPDLTSEESASLLRSKFESSMPLHPGFNGVDSCILDQLKEIKSATFELGLEDLGSENLILNLSSLDCPNYAENLEASNARELISSQLYLSYIDECSTNSEDIVNPKGDLSRRCILRQEGLVKASFYYILFTHVTEYISTLGDEIAVVEQLQVFGNDRSESCKAGEKDAASECQLIHASYEVNLDTEEEYIELFQSVIQSGFLGKNRLSEEYVNDPRISAPLPSYESTLASRSTPRAIFASYQESDGSFARSEPLNW